MFIEFLTRLITQLRNERKLCSIVQCVIAIRAATSAIGTLSHVAFMPRTRTGLKGADFAFLCPLFK